MKIRCLLPTAAAILAVAATPAIAQETEVDGPDESQPSERCIPVSRIDTTKVLDNRNILFYMRGGEIYRNFLPYRCPGLRRRETISYRSTTGRLCNVDSITILRSFGGGLDAGPSCGLGRFYPISEVEVEALENEIERAKDLDLGPLE